MSDPDQIQPDELPLPDPEVRYRQIATDVLGRTGIPDEDRICAAGILSALDAAEHAPYLTVVEVDQRQLRIAAAADAERLWDRYGKREPNEA